MANHMSGPLTVTNGVVADLTGDVVGGQKLPTPTDYGADGALAPALANETLSKAGALAMTLAAPGAGNVGLIKQITAISAQAHVITAASISGGNTLTFGGAIGDNITLQAISATAWVIKSSINVTLSTV